MEINFEKNIGDEVWVIKDNKISFGVVDKIYFYNFISPVDCSTEEMGVKYQVKTNEYCCSFNEDEVFSTKEELIATL